jgi:hypothetical protein
MSLYIASNPTDNGGSFLGHVFKVTTQTNTVTNIAGNNSTGGSAGDGSSATSASFNKSGLDGGICFDSSNNLYIADGTCVRVVNSSGVISLFAGSETQTGYTSDSVNRSNVIFGNITGLFYYNNFLYIIDGGFYGLGQDNSTITKINLSTNITNIFAGIGSTGETGDNGLATNARLNSPTSMCVDANGSFYITESTTVGRIRKVDSSGTISTFLGTGTISYPKSIIYYSGYFYVVGSNKVFKITSTGSYETFAGTDTGGFSGDNGPATSAKLNSPSSICVDSIGNFYIADYANRVVRVINKSGIINTFAGNYVSSGSGSGAALLSGVPGLATSAVIGLPTCVIFLPQQNAPISNVCFLAGTPIHTDQGVVPIDQINKETHTINGNKIVAVTKTISQDKHLVSFEKDSLAKKYPSRNTVMTKNHKIYYKGQMIEAKKFLDLFDGVSLVKYDGEILYNILLEEHGEIVVNNMVCETLHPENLIAKLYTSGLGEKYKNDFIISMNESIEKNDYNTYKKIVKRL